MSVNEDLLRERQNATLNSEDFAIWWSGGKDELLQRRALEKLFFDDKQFDDQQNIIHLSHKKLYEHVIAKSVKVILKLREWYGEQQKQLGVTETTINDMYIFRSLLSGPLGTGLFQQNFPLRLNFSMFLTALLGQANEEQRREWLEKSWNMDGIVGTYAQTELGHGTYIKGLETRPLI